MPKTLSNSITSPLPSSTARPEAPAATTRTSRPPPPRIPRPCRCDLFAPPGFTSGMSAPRSSAQSRRTNSVAGQGNTRSGNQGSGQAPTTQANGQDLAPAHTEDDVALTDDNEDHAEESVNGADPESVGNGNGAYAAPDTNGSAANSGSSDDTSWFKRSCKEVVVPIPKGKLTPGDTTGALANKGISTEISRDKLHVVFSDQDLIWDGTPQVLSYWFIEGTPKQKSKVREAIDEWTWYANVTFEEAASIQDSNIRITFDPNDGSWAYIGKQCEKIGPNEPTMNLAWLDKFSPITSNERATILHEFGHVLGLLHEHQSPAHGGQAIRNLQAAISLYTKTQGWSVQQVYDQVINVYAMNEVSNFSQVDTSSIMHYPQPKEITGLAQDIPYNTKLTDLDKAYIILQYPRKEMHPRAAKDGWNFEKALNVIGAPKDVKARVLQSFYKNKDPESGEIDPQDSRLIIEQWTRSAHLNTGVNGVPNGVPAKLQIAHDVNHGVANDELPRRAHADLPPPPTIGNADVGDSTFIKKLYDQLSKLYNPGGAQYFALQFPTRFLDKQTYAYKLNGYFSRMEKPVVVNEAEFALTDALYDVAPIVGGPNGQTLSRNYEKALNSLIPTFEDKEVRKQREKMRAWLMKTTKAGNAAYTVDTRLSLPGISAQTAKELSDTNGMVITPASGEPALVDQESAKQIAQQAINNIKSLNRDRPRAMTRMEYSESLMQAYLNERRDWELRKDAKFREASEAAASDPSKMEALTRELAHTSAIEEAKIAAKYSDAVVRGYTHTVRGFMGHLDIKTTGESLQDAKDAFRQSALSSVYTASSVWPVAMQPTDWFEALDTGFTREDLSQDSALIEAAVKAKAQLIDTLETQMANLRGFNKGDPAEAKQKMIDAAAAREEAMAKLQQKYTASTISAVKLALEVAALANPTTAALQTAKSGLEFLNKAPDTGDSNEVKESKKTVADLFRGDSTVLTDIGNQMDDVSRANTAVNQASRVLTEHMSQYSEAVAGDTRNLVDALQRQVTSAKAELAELQESYTISKRASPSASADLVKSSAEVGKLPQNNGGSRWSEVQISSVVSNDYSATSSSSSSSVSSYNCSFWLGSSSGSSSSSSAENSSRSMSSTLKVDVAMRTTYVTVDRSGWFDPSLLSMSKSFMRGAVKENYVPWSEWKTGEVPEDATKAIRDMNNNKKPTGYFAAFPVGYVLVKDCVIKIASSATDTSAFKKVFDSQSESSGGFLCFSHSSGSRSSSDSSSSSSTQTQDGIVVRIPGPQILGYVMQLSGQDQSRPFAAMLEADLFFEDEDDAPKPKTSGTTGRANAFNVNTATASDPSPANTGIRSYDEENHMSAAAAPGAPRPPRPANAFNPNASAASASGSSEAPGQLLDALQTALDGSDVSNWLDGQPSGAKEEIWAKLQAAFGKVGR